MATDILFVHNNFPAQYKLLASHLAKQPDYRVFAIGSTTARKLRGIELLKYDISVSELSSVHAFARRFEVECRRAEQVMYAANALKLSGMSPQLIFVHPGWGEALPLRSLFPDARICVYCEFYYRMKGADVGFDPEFGQLGADGLVRVNLRNAATLLAAADADIATSPTYWQRSVFPTEVRPKIHVIHDGLDVSRLSASISSFSHPTLPRPLRRGDEVLTFVARNLEPYRGFHIFMRALPRILRERPALQVCIVGADRVSYGNPPVNHPHWRAALLDEVGSQLDLSRVHFLGFIDYEKYLALLNISRVHTYLTYPFVLSWSLLEALALGCKVVGSDTAPVREVVKDGENGFLVPFFEPDALAERVIEIAAEPERFNDISHRARESVLTRYAFETASLPRYLSLIKGLSPETSSARMQSEANLSGSR